jgi:hypothetical protein
MGSPAYQAATITAAPLDALHIRQVWRASSAN